MVLANHDSSHLFPPLSTFLTQHQVLEQRVQSFPENKWEQKKARVKRLKPATKEQYGIRGEGLGSHGNEGHHDHGLSGRVVWENVVFHIGAKGEVAKDASHCVHSNTNGDGTWGCQGELLGRSLPHAGVDWDRRNMTLKVGYSTYLKAMWYYLIAKAESRNDSKDIGLGFRLVFDRPWCVPSNKKFNHNQDDDVKYGQSACKKKCCENIVPYFKPYLPLTCTSESQLFWSSRTAGSEWYWEIWYQSSNSI